MNGVRSQEPELRIQEAVVTLGGQPLAEALRRRAAVRRAEAAERRAARPLPIRDAVHEI